jgi:hypothetical protein
MQLGDFFDLNSDSARTLEKLFNITIFSPFYHDTRLYLTYNFIFNISLCVYQVIYIMLMTSDTTLYFILFHKLFQAPLRTDYIVCTE